MTVLLLVAGGGMFAEDVYLTARDLATLRSDRQRLTAEVERLETELAVETAKRLELERQAADLNVQVAELDGQVRFLLARRARDRIGD